MLSGAADLESETSLSSIGSALRIDSDRAISLTERGAVYQEERMMIVSDHIKRAAKKVSLTHYTEREIEILGKKYTAVFTRVNGYPVSLLRGEKSISTCVCQGFLFKHRCKHIYYTDMIYRRRYDSNN